MKHDDDPSDLLSEVRRRTLSRDEEARLEGLVARSPEVRVLHYAGWSFDRDSSARDGDDVLVARLAARAAERAANPVAAAPLRRRKRPLVLLLAASLALASTAGAGAGVVYYMKSERTAEVPPPVSAPQSRAKSLGARAAPRLSPTAPAPAHEPPTSDGPTVVPLSAAAPAPKSPATSAPTPAPASPAAASKPGPATSTSDALSASSLFAQANRQRLSGDTRGAIVLYEMLTERHPGTPEASLAELSLGNLLLQTGDASGALTHFRRAGSTGALGSEALWGEANALKTLGRSGEERQTLERLLARYPDGAYAKAARKRLGPLAP
jgi:TolA-binding protein